MGVPGNRWRFKRREEYNLALLNYGFRFFETHRLYRGGKAIAQPTLWKGEIPISLGVKDDIVVTIPRGRYGDPQGRRHGRARPAGRAYAGGQPRCAGA